MEVDQGNTRFSDMISADEHQTEDNVTVLPIELTNITGTHIEHLNEDCLLEIFSNNSLTWMDLCSLAETCSRFGQITQRVFPKDYMLDNAYRGYKFRSKNCTKFYENLQDVKRILKNFGSHLTELVIRRKDQDQDQDLVNLVEKYCGDVTLNHLEFSHFKSIEGVKNQMNSIFQRLRQLYLFDCDFLIDVATQNLNFNSLIELKILGSSGCVVFLKHIFPNLERFYWYFSHVYTKDSNNANHILYNFIRRHGQLKAIYLSDESVCRSGILHVIDSACKKLENLKIMAIQDCSSHLSIDFSTQSGLSKLKSLDFEFNYRNYSKNIMPLLQAVAFSLLSLETIRLSTRSEWPLQIFDVLSQLQNLRELHLECCPIYSVPWAMLPRLKKVYLERLECKSNSADLLNIIRQLTNLEELEYQFSHYDICVPPFDDICLNKEDLTEIVKIVERRDHVLTLKCYCNFELEGNCYAHQKLKLIQRYAACYGSDWGPE